MEDRGVAYAAAGLVPAATIVSWRSGVYSVVKRVVVSTSSGLLAAMVGGPGCLAQGRNVGAGRL